MATPRIEVGLPAWGERGVPVLEAFVGVVFGGTAVAKEPSQLEGLTIWRFHVDGVDEVSECFAWADPLPGPGDRFRPVTVSVTLPVTSPHEALAYCKAHKGRG